MTKITVGLMRDLERQVSEEKISYSRMVELLNEHSLKNMILFIDWLGKKNYTKLIGTYYTNGELNYTLPQLFEIFQNERN